MSLICQSTVHEKRACKWVTVNQFTVDKPFHSFSLQYVLKLTASQTKTCVLLVNQEGHDNLRK